MGTSPASNASKKKLEPWLSGQAGTELLKPAANDVLERWPVSKSVNSFRASDVGAEPSA
jgi:putative SOS response-associated peptidase YedK